MSLAWSVCLSLMITVLRMKTKCQNCQLRTRDPTYTSPYSTLQPVWLSFFFCQSSLKDVDYFLCWFHIQSTHKRWNHTRLRGNSRTIGIHVHVCWKQKPKTVHDIITLKDDPCLLPSPSCQPWAKIVQNHLWAYFYCKYGTYKKREVTQMHEPSFVSFTYLYASLLFIPSHVSYRNHKNEPWFLLLSEK